MQAPLLQTPEGNIVGGNTIARFLAQAGSVKGLSGTSAYHTVRLQRPETLCRLTRLQLVIILCMQALIEEWIELLTSDLQAPLDSWYLPLVGVWSYDKKVAPAAEAFSSLDCCFQAAFIMCGMAVHSCFGSFKHAKHQKVMCTGFGLALVLSSSLWVM